MSFLLLVARLPFHVLTRSDAYFRTFQHPTSPSLILLDTAQAFPSYLPHLRSSILSHPIQPCHLTDIILSHYHLDHVDGLRSVLEELGKIGAVGEKGVRVWKFKCEGDEEEGKDREIEEKLKGIEERLIDTSEMQEGQSLVEEGGKLRALENGQKFSIKGSRRGEENEDKDVELEVVHTPGHTTDSISILLRTTSAPPPSRPLALFSFDTVLGHGTAVFSSLSTYLNSLTSLISLLTSSSSSSSPSSVPQSIPIYPGHGPVIEDGLSKLQEYKQHRLDREVQVVEALKSRKAERVTASSCVLFIRFFLLSLLFVLDPANTLELGNRLTESIYGSTIPESLKPAATRGLLLHLEKLLPDGQVARHGREEEGGEEGSQVDWDKLGVSAKDVPKGWDDKWSWIGAN